MSTTTAADVIEGVANVMMDTSLSSDADFPPISDGELEENRDRPRAMRIDPTADGPSGRTQTAGGWRTLTLRFSLQYPRDPMGRRKMLEDAPTVEDRLRRLGGANGLLAALDTPIVTTNTVVRVQGYETGGSSQFGLADWGSGIRYAAVWTVGIDYLRSTP
jgi:hypothetical protein